MFNLVCVVGAMESTRSVAPQLLPPDFARGKMALNEEIELKHIRTLELEEGATIGKLNATVCASTFLFWCCTKSSYL